MLDKAGTLRRQLQEDAEQEPKIEERGLDQVSKKRVEYPLA
jgi:hypothetical protein